VTLDIFIYWIGLVTLVPGGAVLLATAIAVVTFTRVDDLGRATVLAFFLAAGAAFIWLVVWASILFT